MQLVEDLEREAGIFGEDEEDSDEEADEPDCHRRFSTKTQHWPVPILGREKRCIRIHKAKDASARMECSVCNVALCQVRPQTIECTGNATVFAFRNVSRPSTPRTLWLSRTNGWLAKCRTRDRSQLESGNACTGKHRCRDILYVCR